MLCQELHLSAAEPTAANYNRKDATVVNYSWGEKRIFHMFLRTNTWEKAIVFH